MKFKIGDIVVRNKHHQFGGWKIGATPVKIIGIKRTSGEIELSSIVVGEYGAWDSEKFYLYNDSMSMSVSKTPLDMLFRIKFIKDIADVFAFGESKYPNVNGDFSWRSRTDVAVFVTERFGSCLRHVFAHVHGQRLDSESGKPHLAHAICNLLMIADVEFKGE